MNQLTQAINKLNALTIGVIFSLMVLVGPLTSFAIRPNIAHAQANNWTTYADSDIPAADGGGHLKILACKQITNTIYGQVARVTIVISNTGTSKHAVATVTRSVGGGQFPTVYSAESRSWWNGVVTSMQVNASVAYNDMISVNVFNDANPSIPGYGTGMIPKLTSGTVVC